MARPKQLEMGDVDYDPFLPARLDQALRKVKKLRPRDRKLILEDLAHAVSFANTRYPYLYKQRGRRNPKKLAYYILYSDVERVFTGLNMKVTVCRNQLYGTESVYLGVIRVCIEEAGLLPIKNLEQSVSRARKGHRVKIVWQQK